MEAQNYLFVSIETKLRVTKHYHMSTTVVGALRERVGQLSAPGRVTETSRDFLNMRRLDRFDAIDDPDIICRANSLKAFLEKPLPALLLGDSFLLDRSTLFFLKAIFCDTPA